MSLKLLSIFFSTVWLTSQQEDLFEPHCDAMPLQLPHWIGGVDVPMLLGHLVQFKGV
jgi:hypothetical protein